MPRTEWGELDALYQRLLESNVDVFENSDGGRD